MKYTCFIPETYECTLDSTNDKEAIEEARYALKMRFNDASFTKLMQMKNNGDSFYATIDKWEDDADVNEDKLLASAGIVVEYDEMFNDKTQEYDIALRTVKTTDFDGTEHVSSEW